MKVAFKIVTTIGFVAVHMCSVLADEGVDAQVFNENTSFVEMIAKRKNMERDPASLTPLARVIGVRRELGLNDEDSNKAARDIILNVGTEGGLGEGMVLNVFRKIPVLDPYKENQQSELEIEFAQVKIFHAQEDVSIARIEKMKSIETGAVVGTRAILVGDYVGRTK